MSEWRETTLGAVCELKRGYDLPARERVAGGVPIVSSSGITGYHSTAKVRGPGVVTGRYGTLGDVFFIVEDFWPLNTALYVRDFKGNDPHFVAALLQSLDLGRNDGAAAVPGVNRNHLHLLPVRCPDTITQRRIGLLLRTLDALIENNRRRIELLEQMAQAIYQEWFVYFRYPGHEDAALVDSTLGPIPRDWGVRRVAAIAGAERNAVTGGPFGSKLGRKDYVDIGVPVLRGANLRVGGGFDETDLVFVSEAKAAELRGSLATRGDVIVTQRGTLGQVGLISPRSRFGRYLLSQSQMKITVDGAKATAEFIYAQFRTPETTGRFIAQAMSSGVPHVNLALLREFEILLPPLAIQAAFTEVLAPLSSQELHLSEQRRVLISIRDLLLPRLVTGQIDVSNLDLESLTESVA